MIYIEQFSKRHPSSTLFINRIRNKKHNCRENQVVGDSFCVEVVTFSHSPCRRAQSESVLKVLVNPGPLLRSFQATFRRGIQRIFGRMRTWTRWRAIVLKMYNKFPASALEPFEYR
jgi:hypothetical protein